MNLTPAANHRLIWPSRPARGAFRERHGRWGGMRWTRVLQARKRGRMKPSRTAKPCGPDAPTLASSLLRNLRMTVANKPGHRGERGVNRKAIAQGVPA